MKVKKFETRDEWMKGRKGKVTGSAKIVPSATISKAQLLEEAEKNKYEYKKSWTIAQLTGLFSEEQIKEMEMQAMLKAEKLQGFYKLVADRLTINDNEEETALEHGVRMEDEAIAKFAESEGLTPNTDLVIWESDMNPNIALSPDAYEDAEKVTWAIETKCLTSDNHIKAILTDTFPAEYDFQKKQYFVVNPDLETLYFVLYDARFIKDELKMKVFEIKREDVQESVDFLTKFQEATLAEVDALVEKLTF